MFKFLIILLAPDFINFSAKSFPILMSLLTSPSKLCLNTKLPSNERMEPVIVFFLSEINEYAPIGELQPPPSSFMNDLS